MKFSKDIGKVLLMERKNPLHQWRLGTDWLASSSAKKDLRVLVNVGQQCASETKQAYCLLGSIHSNIANRSTILLFPRYSALSKPHLEYYTQLCVPQ